MRSMTGSRRRDELRECEKYLAARSTEAGVKQLVWAMLTSAEFQLNP
jgi:hypothetical protein